eukprot:COSAG06_NODE_5472_length_3459_cov_200.129167_4_plen_125_part_00
MLALLVLALALPPARAAPPAGLYGMTGAAAGPPGNAQLVFFAADGTQTPLGSKNTEYLNGHDAATLDARTATFFQNSQAAHVIHTTSSLLLISKYIDSSLFVVACGRSLHRTQPSWATASLRGQ